ncbi:hypothetical protein, partial [Bradyrhizobium sp.]|uniref:hypothetical protein n=1 Tax=Bradyrhizobium sp. TaxID=376 RepID=UPI00403817CF
RRKFILCTACAMTATEYFRRYGVGLRMDFYCVDGRLNICPASCALPTLRLLGCFASAFVLRASADKSLAMTWKHTYPFPRHDLPEVLPIRLLPLRKEGAEKAGRRLRPQHRVQGVVKERTRI